MNFFGLVHRWIERDPLRYQQLLGNIISARIGMTLERYLTLSIQVSLLSGVGFAIFGWWMAGILFSSSYTQGYTGIYNILQVPFPSIQPSPGMLLWWQIAGALFAFLLGFFFVYYIALKYPGMQKSSRATKINLTIHNAVAYMYAMRKGGAELMVIFRSLSESASIYGEVAMEFRQVVRDADFFGYDVISALRHLMETTPSEKMKQFLEDMISVIESGGDLASFLSNRVRLFQEEARFEQKQFLNFLSLVAESYVTLFVAGPLFLIIIMVVMGLVGGLAALQMTMVVYMLLPIGSTIFIVLIDIISIKSEIVQRYTFVKWLHEYSDVRVFKKTGEEIFFAKLVRYDQLRNVRNFLRHPLQFFTRHYNATLLITVPIAVAYIAAVLVITPHYTNVETYIDVIDDHLIIILLIVLVPYSVFYELWRRNIQGMESLIPEFLERMAGINQVGLTIAQAISIMVNTNLGLLSYEIRRIKRDIDWGATFSDALLRFEDRVRTPLIARTVVLITKASRMSGSIGDVLAIAASDAKMTDTLKRERLSDMFIYTAIIYLAFIVFLFVVGVISSQFIPVLGTINTSGVPTGTGLSGITPIGLQSIKRLMYHAVLVQALFSGLIAGQMGEGSLKSGLKHSCIMLIITLLVFNYII
ncbi:flagellar protein FlaJ [Methanolinea mesophila]|uniref:type II secretion system F family protein n=1 Tax=Methanolinea mesophila TaxID=547055 RepID=UPI001AE27281|nr:type II secretion system F family protein [Methanolinea mesophila]MBP1927996.1 flagellar protein FlaJ [Methanolinea mesophila]